MITTFENRCVIKNYLIVLRPFFDTTYKWKNRSKNIRDIYIMNWSYSYKVGFFFAVYKIMILKGTSWAGPHLLLPYTLSSLPLLPQSMPLPLPMRLVLFLFVLWLMLLHPSPPFWSTNKPFQALKLTSLLIFLLREFRGWLSISIQTCVRLNL